MYQNVPECTLVFSSMAKSPTGAKLRQIGLEPVLVNRFLDFCEGYEGAPAHRLIARALEAYMVERYLAEPEVKRRADEARRIREDR
jgi:hypothetical protein